jgi:hypothetical protein
MCQDASTQASWHAKRYSMLKLLQCWKQHQTLNLQLPTTPAHNPFRAPSKHTDNGRSDTSNQPPTVIQADHTLCCSPQAAAALKCVCANAPKHMNQEAHNHLQQSKATTALAVVHTSEHVSRR